MRIIERVQKRHRKWSMSADVGIWILNSIFVFIMASSATAFSNKYLRKNTVVNCRVFALSQLLYLAGAFFGYGVFLIVHVVAKGGFSGMAIAFLLMANLFLFTFLNFGVSFYRYFKGRLRPVANKEVLVTVLVVFALPLLTFLSIQ